MDLDQARQVVRHAPIHEAPQHHFDDYAWDDAFNAAPAHVQEPYREAMAVFLEQGSGRETEEAIRFFAVHGLGAPEAGRVAALYVERGWDSEHPLARTLAYWSHHLKAPERAALEHLFVADPLKHFILARAVLTGARGPAWDAFAGLVKATRDVSILHDAYDATVVPRLHREFCALLAKTPEPVIRALAAKFHDSGDELLRDCGLQPPRRLSRDEVTARLEDGTTCLVRPAWGVEKGDRFALYVEGPQVKVVHYNPGPGRVRKLMCGPASELGSAVARYTGLRVEDDRLAPMTTLDVHFLEAVAAREAREHELRRALADPARWVGGVPSDWIGMEARLRHSAVLGWHRLGLEGGRPARAAFHDDGAMAFFFDVLLYHALEGDAEPVPPELRGQIDAAERAFDDARRRLRAGTLAVRDDSLIPSRFVALAGDGFHQVSLDGGVVTGKGERLNENWERMFFEGVFGAALRGELAERLIPLTPR